VTDWIPPDWLPSLVAVAWLACIALIGGLLTNVGEWYENLRFPRIRPPNWLFGPAWTTIYVFIAVASVLTWNAADADQRSVWLVLLAVNTVLNVVWSPLFFTLKRPDWAFYELIPFWLSILALILEAYQIRPFAAAFFAPYILWVTFAGWLNWRIVELNRPFGARSR
jgi:tryptophan-rich sensory protein